MNANEPLMMPRRSFVRGITALGLWPLAAAPGGAAEPPDAPGAGGLEEWPGEDDPGYWPWIRRQFSIPPDEAYFNSGTLGACPRQVLNTVLDSMREMEKTMAQYDYRPEHPEYIAGYRTQEALRKKAGGIINAT